MKTKKLFIVLFASVITATCFIAINTSDAKSTDALVLENIEALSNPEGGGKCTGPKKFGECECRNSKPCSDGTGCMS